MTLARGKSSRTLPRPFLSKPGRAVFQENAMNSEKTCTKCGEAKLLADFYKDNNHADGLYSRCKKCHNALTRTGYRLHFKSRQACGKRYSQSAIGKAAMARSIMKQRAHHPLRFKVRKAVSNAIQVGHLVPQPCEVCGEGKTQAHHDDYNKPLEVRWLCHKHHCKEHGNLDRIETP